MTANVSFGILAFHPFGWLLMLLVVLLEAWLLGRCLRATVSGRRFLALALAANAVSGLAGFVVSLALDGGWWLVVWVPWVTQAEVGDAQWGRLAVYLAVAYLGSIAIETEVAVVWLRAVPFARVLAAQAVVNLVSSVALFGFFWSSGGGWA